MSGLLPLTNVNKVYQLGSLEWPLDISDGCWLTTTSVISNGDKERPHDPASSLMFVDIHVIKAATYPKIVNWYPPKPIRH